MSDNKYVWMDKMTYPQIIANMHINVGVSNNDFCAFLKDTKSYLEHYFYMPSEYIDEFLQNNFARFKIGDFSIMEREYDFMYPYKNENFAKRMEYDIMFNLKYEKSKKTHFIKNAQKMTFIYVNANAWHKVCLGTLYKLKVAYYNSRHSIDVPLTQKRDRVSEYLDEVDEQTILSLNLSHLPNAHPDFKVTVRGKQYTVWEIYQKQQAYNKLKAMEAK